MIMAYGYIYSIENQVNGKVYIGQSVNPQKSPRFKQRFIWKYTKKTNGKKKQFSSNDLNKLEEKVLAAGYPWEKLEAD